MASTLAPKETAALARALLAKQIDGEIARIVIPRADRLIAIIGTLEGYGYPADAFALANASLWPYVFQEAIYDSIDWHARDPGKLGHLREILELDFLVQMSGRRWADGSDAEHAEYRTRCSNALNWRTRENAWFKQLRELAGKLGAAFFAEED